MTQFYWLGKVTKTETMHKHILFVLFTHADIYK